MSAVICLSDHPDLLDEAALRLSERWNDDEGAQVRLYGADATR